jgi:hypothetical protein
MTPRPNWQVGERARLRERKGEGGVPRSRAGRLVTIRAIGGTAAAPFTVLVDDGDPANPDMKTNGHPFSDWVSVDALVPVETE